MNRPQSNPWNCIACTVEVGGYFGNKVYGNTKTGLCKGCEEAQDPTAQRCIKLTGMTPSVYQKVQGRAWSA